MWVFWAPLFFTMSIRMNVLLLQAVESLSSFSWAYAQKSETLLEWKHSSYVKTQLKNSCFLDSILRASVRIRIKWIFADACIVS